MTKLKAGLTVSEAALEELAAFLGQEENEGKAVRIYIAGIG